MSPLSKLSDQQLALLLKEGNHAAFTEIYDRYSDLMFRYAYRWLQDREAVRDVIQEMFASIWAKYDSLRFETNISGYLYHGVKFGILRRIRLDKNARDYMESLQASIDEGHSITDYRIREKQFRAIIDGEIAQLPARMRECFELSRYEFLTYAEIAERLGISEETVRVQIKKALRVLRERLSLFLYLYFLFRW